MKIDKSLLSGSTTMLIMKLLESRDMYGYQMIEELQNRSDDTFTLKAGTLYPILHGLEQKKMIESYDASADSLRTRKYYHLTKAGLKYSRDKQAEWRHYASAVSKVLGGGQYAV